MDFHKSKVLLKKINALHDSAESFDGKFSKLEKDLILEYLRNLYEVLQDDEVSQSSANTGVKAQTVVAPAPIKVVPQEVPEVTVPVVETPVVNEIKVEKPVVKVALDEPTAEVVEEVVVTTSVPEVENLSAFAALFEDDQVKDVSSKFSLKPLADINKGMGINDKILMINSLFGGDQQLFSGSVAKLNELSSFDDAKRLITSGLATKNDWLSDQKIDTAKRFIHLIKRRYQ